MKKISVFLLALLCLQFTSCDKGEILQQNSIEVKAINPSELTRMVDSYEVSQEQDAIIFFVGKAFESVMSNNLYLRKELSNTLKIGRYHSLTVLLDYSDNAKKEINEKIAQLLEESNAYKDWQIQVLNDYKGEDYLSLFSEKINSQNSKEEFVFYVPDEISFNKENTDIALGVDISLPNKDTGLVFYKNSATIITLEEAQKLGKNLVFIGINRIFKNAINKTESRKCIMVSNK